MHGPSGLFQSFWLGGFEAADHITRSGQRLDLLVATQHEQQASSDYALLHAFGITTVRDGIRWYRVDLGEHIDVSSLTPMVQAAEQHRIQVMWSLCHYGWPDDLDLFSPSFVDRFARYCRAVAQVIADHTERIPWYVPINEISFLAWAAGEVGYIFPWAVGRGFEVKRQLVRAAIAGIEAIWAVDRRARIVHVDPIMHVVPPRTRPDLTARAARERASQFEAWDMLAGRIAPELGGAPQYLDVVGVNIYPHNQWEFGETERRPLRWNEPRDARWRPVHQLLDEVWRRYQRPLFISETSHVGVHRGPWIQEIAEEVRQAWALGVPVGGICLYPLLDRPDWDDPDHWHHSGLWELVTIEGGRLQRVMRQDYAAALRAAQQRLQ